MRATARLSYWPAAHALCHLASASAAEHRQLREIAALAKAIAASRASGAEPARSFAAAPPAVERYFRAPMFMKLFTVEERMTRQQRKQVEHAGSPTACRPGAAQHGLVERLCQTIAIPPAPVAAISGRRYLAMMERRATITAGMRQAGEIFARVLPSRNSDPLRALDLSRLRFGERSPRRDMDGPGSRIEAARTAYGAPSRRWAASPPRPVLRLARPRLGTLGQGWAIEQAGAAAGSARNRLRASWWRARALERIMRATVDIKIAFSN